jgi:hypothetical protein
MDLLLAKLNETKSSSHQFVTIKRRERIHFEKVLAVFAWSKTIDRSLAGKEISVISIKNNCFA